MAERTIKVGEVYDSPDDTARVALITGYIGSRTVGTYRQISADNTLTGSKSDTIKMIDNDTDEQQLKTVSGAFYNIDGVESNGPFDATADILATLYYYVEGGKKYYLKRTEIRSSGDGKPFKYQYEKVHDFVPRGASLPEATDFIHLNYGVWAPLEKADDTGLNKVATLGIGFVDELSTGSGMTEDMLNYGALHTTAPGSPTCRSRMRRATARSRLSMVFRR